MIFTWSILWKRTWWRVERTHCRCRSKIVTSGIHVTECSWSARSHCLVGRSKGLSRCTKGRARHTKWASLLLCVLAKSGPCVVSLYFWLEKIYILVSCFFLVQLKKDAIVDQREKPTHKCTESRIAVCRKPCRLAKTSSAGPSKKLTRRWLVSAIAQSISWVPE